MLSEDIVFTAELSEEAMAVLLAKLTAPDAGECCICMELPSQPRITCCGQGPFCMECILRALENQAQAKIRV